MKGKRFLLAILVLLVLLEIVRRVASFAICYATLRYSDFLVGTSRAAISQECRDRHLWFPLRF